LCFGACIRVVISDNGKRVWGYPCSLALRRYLPHLRRVYFLRLQAGGGDRGPRGASAYFQTACGEVTWPEADRPGCPSRPVHVPTMHGPSNGEHGTTEAECRRGMPDHGREKPQRRAREATKWNQGRVLCGKHCQIAQAAGFGDLWRRWAAAACGHPCEMGRGSCRTLLPRVRLERNRQPRLGLSTEPRL
jgi:hypothetical protein